MCVQRFDDSLNSAIHITYRVSLRSSSMREPRDPLLKVLTNFLIHGIRQTVTKWFWFGLLRTDSAAPPPARGVAQARREAKVLVSQWFEGRSASPPSRLSNDPSAGSPTETLLRLLLPLNDQV